MEFMLTAITTRTSKNIIITMRIMIRMIDDNFIMGTVSLSRTRRLLAVCFSYDAYCAATILKISASVL